MNCDCDPIETNVEAALGEAEEKLRRKDHMLDSVFRCLDRALGAMNRAIEITTAEGPAVAIEFIADYLNDTDSNDEDVVDRTPDDWLTRWQVTRLPQRDAP